MTQLGRADIAGLRLKGEIHLVGATCHTKSCGSPFQSPPGPVLMSADNDVTAVRQLMHISADGSGLKLSTVGSMLGRFY
jgi:hypothetical protein